jgi:hypothetical protein
MGKDHPREGCRAYPQAERICGADPDLSRHYAYPPFRA